VLHATYTTKDLDDLLGSTEQALQQSSAEEMQNALGDKRDFFERFHHEAEREPAASDTSKHLRAALNEVESEWRDRGSDAVRMKRALTGLRDAAVEIRSHQGNLQPPAQLALSPYSRQVTEPKQPSARLGTLPAHNVAYLGRSLFSDYLLAVELGGTLLLVATIGAIAIAARRAEGLR
jgi:hypothetical protein